MHKFRTQLLATAATMALSGAAYAADMPVKAPPPMAPAAPVVNWTGFYVGAQIGGASFDPSCSTTVTGFTFVSAMPCNNFSTDGEGTVFSSKSLSSAGVIGGGKAGFDYQWDRAVFGVLGEFDGADLNGSSQIVSTADNGPGSVATATANEKINWLASARLRAGWAFDNVLFYATGGVAWASIKASTSIAGTCCGDFASPETSTTKTGAVAGGGFEYRVTPHVSVVGEVLWYGFGTTTVNAVNSLHESYTTSFRSQDVVSGTLGVTWRF